MTKLKLEEIKKACEKATPGPWVKHYQDGGSVLEILGKSPVDYKPGFIVADFDSRIRPNMEDANFIFNSRQWVPELVKEIEILREALEKNGSGYGAE